MSGSNHKKHASSSSSSSSSKVMTAVCPDIALPTDIKRGIKHRQTGWNVFHRPISSSSSSSFTKHANKKAADDKKPLSNHEEFKAKKEEQRQILGNIKEFNAHATLGKSRRQYEEERLVALGVQPKKQEKMPFKIKLRIEKVQKNREKKRSEELKQSDEVIAKSLQVGVKRKQGGGDNDSKKKKKLKKY